MNNQKYMKKIPPLSSRTNKNQSIPLLFLKMNKKTICCPKISNLIKHIVSKKKHRIYNDLFDLDLSYITEHMIAMGYPSTGCESIYRNSLIEIKNFLNKYHSHYKIYNLCLEEK